MLKELLLIKAVAERHREVVPDHLLKISVRDRVLTLTHNLRSRGKEAVAIVGDPAIERTVEKLDPGIQPIIVLEGCLGFEIAPVTAVGRYGIVFCIADKEPAGWRRVLRVAVRVSIESPVSPSSRKVKQIAFRLSWSVRLVFRSLCRRFCWGRRLSRLGCVLGQCGGCQHHRKRDDQFLLVYHFPNCPLSFYRAVKLRSVFEPWIAT